MLRLMYLKECLFLMLCKKAWIIFFVRNRFPFWLRGCWLGELVGCGCAISSSFYPQAADKLDSLHFVNFQLWTSNIIHRPKHYRSFNLDHKLISNLCVLRIIIEIVISRLKPIYINSTSNCLGKIALSTNGHNGKLGITGTPRGVGGVGGGVGKTHRKVTLTPERPRRESGGSLGLTASPLLKVTREEPALGDPGEPDHPHPGLVSCPWSRCWAKKKMLENEIIGKRPCKLCGAKHWKECACVTCSSCDDDEICCNKCLCCDCNKDAEITEEEWSTYINDRLNVSPGRQKKTSTFFC